MVLPTRHSAVLLCLIFATLCGCGRRGLVDFRAVVKLDGQPIDGAAITLTRVDGEGRSAMGVSESDGSVRFTTFEPYDGVLPGTYKVTVNKAPKSPADEFVGADMSDPEVAERYRLSVEGGAFLRYVPSLLPKIYLSNAKTPLQCTVPSDESPVVFDLDSEADKKAKQE